MGGLGPDESKDDKGVKRRMVPFLRRAAWSVIAEPSEVETTHSNL